MSKIVNAETIQKSLSAGSKKRLDDFKRNLTRDVDEVIFDKRLLDVALKYAKNPGYIQKVRFELNHLKNSGGEPFCQSIYHYDLLRSQIDGFKGGDYTSFRWNAQYQKAIKNLKDVFSNLRLSPLHYYSDDDIMKNLPKTTTHSGWTFIETGLKQKGAHKEGIFERHMEAEKEAVQNGSFNRPILPGRRIQGSAYDEDGNLLEFAKLKNRVVNMVDLLVIISELRYAKPIQKFMGEWNYYAGGKSPSEISTIIVNDRIKYPYFISLDYSAYDQTLSSWLIEDAFDILHSAFKEINEDLWNVIVHDFIHKEMITAEDSLRIVKGVPSGSMFTQIIDSICNILMIQTYLYAIGSDGHMLVMGDDNLCYSNVFIDPENIASYVTKNFGVKVNASKTTRGTKNDYPRFLSREWRNGEQWRHPNVILAKMMFPERWRDYIRSDVTPELVFYAYFLTYGAGMREIFNIDQFFTDFPKLKVSPDVWKVDSRYIPGALAFSREYLGVN